MCVRRRCTGRKPLRVGCSRWGERFVHHVIFTQPWTSVSFVAQPKQTLNTTLSQHTIEERNTKVKFQHIQRKKFKHVPGNPPYYSLKLPFRVISCFFAHVFGGMQGELDTKVNWMEHTGCWVCAEQVSLFLVNCSLLKENSNYRDSIAVSAEDCMHGHIFDVGQYFSVSTLFSRVPWDIVTSCKFKE